MHVHVICWSVSILVGFFLNHGIPVLLTCGQWSYPYKMLLEITPQWTFNSVNRSTQQNPRKLVINKYWWSHRPLNLINKVTFTEIAIFCILTSQD